jgi:pimeloyl-ACP methyl ester carboxylesterase
MRLTESADGTKIAYAKQGAGPPLIVVDGAMSTRSSGSKPDLIDRLAPAFTVFSYDRRGRGDSGDTMPYAVQREIEDIAALIELAGGAACLYGHSSGASLALEAAAALGGSVVGLAMYDAPYNDDADAKVAWGRYIEQLTDALADGRRGDAVAAFMRYIGTPADQVDAMRSAPFWPGMEALAPSLAYDHTGLLGADAAVPAGRAARVRCPALVMHGGASHPFMAVTARTLAEVMPDAELRTVQGQDHNVDPAVLAPILAHFFASH